jgi:glycosyltransferase involved in cell wall biosynthesis
MIEEFLAHAKADSMTTIDRPTCVRRVLALTPIPEEGAGCRFRISQFIPYLESAGYQVIVSPFFTPEFFRLVYRPGHFWTKITAFAGLSLGRLRSLRRLSQYDLIFIYREAFPIGPPLIERWLARPGRPPIVYDFDDAVFLPNVSDANRFFVSLKWVRKVPEILRRSTRVIAGNDYLAQFARAHNPAVVTIPTCVDTDRFVPRRDARGSGPLVIGWIGSPTTAAYLSMLDTIFRRLRAATPFEVKISGAGSDVIFEGVPVRNVPWSLAEEVALFNTCDIGVYPLTDDEWAKGKCGFKAIQFMACGVPVVASAVGVNREIIEDGVNGFLATTADEWEAKLRRLLTEPALRARFAEAGRRTVEERYSLRVCAPKVAAAFEEALTARRRSRAASPVL